MLKSINRRLLAKEGKIENKKDPSLHALEIVGTLIGGRATQKNIVVAIYNKTKKEITFSSRSSEIKTSILLQ